MDSEKQASDVTYAVTPGGKQAEITQDQTCYVKGSVELPKSHNVCGVTVWAYSHPRVQAIMLGCVLFLTVGMYNVITFLGGAGQQTAWLSDIANISLYTVFTVFNLIAPACLNYFGLRKTLCFGGVGYAAYAASLWCFNRTGNTPFVVFGGCWCGLSAAFLWVAEGTAITAFASEDKKGMYVSIFWSIFQFGVVIGAAIPVGQNWNAGDNNKSTVTDGTYIGFMILMLLGSALGLCLYPWQKMVREDGSRVLLEKQKTFTEELWTSYYVFMDHKWIAWAWPYFWAVNYYVIYQNNCFNGVFFTVRGRSLNTFCSGVIQIPAAWMLNIFTDKLPCKRRWRAFWGLLYVFISFNAVWLGGYWAMKKTTYGLDEKDRMDVFDKDYGWYAFLFTMYGFSDATFNCYAFWFMGALSNETSELSVYCAMYRLLNAACQICGYSLDLQGYSKEFMFGSSWAFVAAGPILMLPIIKWHMKDTNMKQIDEVIEGLDVKHPTNEQEVVEVKN
ncbi:major facilitator superfamily domain-containing protein [Phyllosticta capitalensis]